VTLSDFGRYFNYLKPFKNHTPLNRAHSWYNFFTDEQKMMRGYNLDCCYPVEGLLKVIGSHAR